MDEKTLTALQGSIKKWEEIVNGTGVDDGTANCPLCIEFNEKFDDSEGWRSDGCIGCPVAEKVQAACCSGTPYMAWAEHSWDKGGHRGHPYRVCDATGKELAQAELDFLRSLVPSPSR